MQPTNPTLFFVSVMGIDYYNNCKSFFDGTKRARLLLETVPSTRSYRAYYPVAACAKMHIIIENIYFNASSFLSLRVKCGLIINRNWNERTGLIICFQKI